MFNISLGEILLILIAVLVVLGPERLPALAKRLGKWFRKARRTGNLLRELFVFDEPSMSEDDWFRKRKEKLDEFRQTATPQPQREASAHSASSRLQSKALARVQTAELTPHQLPVSDRKNCRCTKLTSSRHAS